MAFMEWSEDYATGIDAMDQQHKQLVNLMVQFYNSMNQGSSAAEAKLERTLASLTDYAREHFHDEEELMRRRFYPQLQEHIQQHGDLVKSLSLNVQHYRDGSLPPVRLAMFIRDWILKHILEEDKKYGVYILSRNKYLY